MEDDNNSPIALSDIVSNGQHENQAESAMPSLEHVRKHERSSTTGDNTAQERFNWDQIEFVIQTRDNNMPDPFGTHSTTPGKLSYPAVANLYNTKFGLNVGSAAIEKRYRTRIEEYCMANPSYPRDIVYAKKAKGSGNVAKPDAQETPLSSKRATDKLGKLNQGNLAKLNYGNLERLNQGNLRKFNQVNRPPEDLVQASDLNRYIEDTWATSAADDGPEFVRFLVQDWSGSGLGTVAAAKGDLKHTSGTYREQNRCTQVHTLVLEAPSKAAVDRYLHCITSPRLPRLPECDYTLKLVDNVCGEVSFSIECARIGWTFTELTEMYDVATHMRDNFVRDLVLDFWRKRFQYDEELEFDLESLTWLFKKTSRDDPACRFWALVIHSHETLQQLVEAACWNATLKNKLDFLLRQAPGERPWEWSDEDFCRNFHYHRAGSRCRYDAKDGDIDFRSIARRLLAVEDLKPSRASMLQSGVTLELKKQYMTACLDQNTR